MTQPPNPRLQRTRFALLRSPLSRKPLGDKAQSVCLHMIAASLLLTVACESAGGHLRPIWSSGSAILDYGPSENTSPTQLVTVIVHDPNGMPMPGVSLVFTSPEGEVLPEELSDAKGAVEYHVRPGKWRLAASSPPFRSLKTKVPVKAGRACTVKLYLRVKDGAVVTVILSFQDERVA